MKKKNRLFFALCICLVFLVALTGCSSSQTSKDNEPITLIFTTHDNENTWFVQEIIAPWIADVEKASSGRIIIEPHYGGELVGFYDSYDAAVKGTVDIAYICPSNYSDQFALSQINLLTSADKVNWRPGTTYWEMIQKFPEMQTEYSDVHLLAVGQFFEPYLGTVSKPINKFADMKGLQWLAIGEWSSKRLAAWGATPANVPPSDLFSSLQKGVLQGTAISLNTLEGIGLKDVIKYLSKVNNDSVNVSFVMNKDKWDSIPADLQKILTDEGLKLTENFDKAQIDSELAFQKKAADEWGMKFIDVPASELAKFEAAGSTVRNKLATSLDEKGLPGTAVKDYFLQLEEKYSAAEYAPKQ